MNNRVLGAKLAEDFYSGKIDFNQFALNFPDDEDDADLTKLFDLIEHQPKVGGFFGESKSNSILRMEQIKELIELIKK